MDKNDNCGLSLINLYPGCVLYLFVVMSHGVGREKDDAHPQPAQQHFDLWWWWWLRRGDLVAETDDDDEI